MLRRRLRSAAGQEGVAASTARRVADALRSARAEAVTQPFTGSSAVLVWALPVSPTRMALRAAPVPDAEAVARPDVDRLVVELFEQEGHSLVRLARLFVDDRNAAEDLVQEGFIRLARAAPRLQDPSKAAPYLRSIVLNLARDHNRRGLVSLRHHLPLDDRVASIEDEVALQDDQRQVIEALRDLPPRQRDCLVLRYYQELGIDDIAATLSLSPNSVKTHLRRGLAAMERLLGERPGDASEAHRAPVEAEGVGS